MSLNFGFLRQHATEVDLETAWPTEQLLFLAEEQFLAWGLPPEFGGLDKTAIEMAEMYRDMASACLLTTFVLTQRNACCQRLAASDNEELKAERLPKLIAGEEFTTVGISHLSTSRQHLKKPAVTATPNDDGSGYQLSGTIPWVTGAPAADWLLVGGVLDSGEQLLALIQPADSNVEIPPYATLLSLTGSQTGPVVLNQVDVPNSRIVAGPTEHVMKKSSGGAGSVTTSALAIGVAHRAIQMIREEADRRDDLVEIIEPLEREYDTVNQQLLAISGGETEWNGEAISSETLRKAANSMVLRASQAYLAATKGAGYVAGHPAERTIREAMFFLVWSCPQPVLSAAMREFACVN